MDTNTKKRHRAVVNGQGDANWLLGESNEIIFR